jgi:ABC-2 type transport system permease protein
MSNVLAIAGKELRSYFSSPIAYVIIGLFALVFGFFFATLVFYFDRQSLQTAGFGGGPTMNINEQLIRPVFQNTLVVLLFALPLVTMRTYAEEKRSGTMELLLTAPLTDLQIILGKFFGALGLFAAMLAVTLLHVAILFVFGQPEWKPLVTTYFGLLLMGGCFISVGLLVSSLTKNQIVAGMTTFVIFLMFWIINWIASFFGPTAQAVLNYLSIIEHVQDFTRGIVDTKHLVYYISFISFGLFLTARSVDTERWRG